MKNKYYEIVKHISSLEDHGHLYMYYGAPYSEECYIYGDDDDLIVSYECHELCTNIAETFQHEYEWLDIMKDNQINLENIFDVDVEAQDFEVIASMLLYLVESIVLEDKFIDALNNGYLIRVLRRLEYLSKRPDAYKP